MLASFGRACHEGEGPPKTKIDLELETDAPASR
jgi:hypothetical protein